MASQIAAAAYNNGQPLKRANGLVLVLDTPKGRGVFASHRIEQGTVIDISPVLIFSEAEVKNHLEHTCLNHYTYNWPSPTNPRNTTQAMALGLGSLFNHSTLHQNVGWRRDLAIESIVYTALSDIEVGQELCISYGNGRLWFKDADADAEANATTAKTERGHGDQDWVKEAGAEAETSNNCLGVLEMSGLGGIETEDLI